MNKVVNGATTRITLPFGNGHLGVDLGWVGGEGDNIYAHSDGVVTAVVTGRPKNNNTRGMDTYGNYVDIKHPNGYLTRYAHLSSVDVKRGDKVSMGTKIGYMGESGNTFGKHLHFEVRKPDGNIIDPVPYLRADLPNMPKTEPPAEDNNKTVINTADSFKVGDKVVPKHLVDYNGTPVVQYDKYYTISELVGHRAVLSARGQVWCAIHTTNLKHYE